jgi:hypothetical protein
LSVHRHFTPEYYHDPAGVFTNAQPCHETT